MASLSTCHLELVVRDGNLVQSCIILEPLLINYNSRQCEREKECVREREREREREQHFSVTVITLCVFRNCAVELVRDK